MTSVSRDELEGVLREEIRCWRDQLCWDYRPAADLIQQYVSTRSLAGYALKGDGGWIGGYVYYIVDHPVGYLGNLFVRDELAENSSYRGLLVPAIESLKSSSRTRRIESQLFPFNFDFPPLFSELGFQVLPRHFLERSITREDQESSQEPMNLFQLENWASHLFWEAAEVIFDSYQDSADGRLCHDYGSRRGCVRFLRNLMNSPGCGRFRPELSMMAFDDSGRLAGLLIASQIAPTVGMIPQISVRRHHQGRGLGSWMLQRHFGKARRRGLKRVSPSVSAENRGAYRLYRKLGFEERKSFHAFVWEAS